MFLNMAIFHCVAILAEYQHSQDVYYDVRQKFDNVKKMAYSGDLVAMLEFQQEIKHLPCLSEERNKIIKNGEAVATKNITSGNNSYYYRARFRDLMFLKEEALLDYQQAYKIGDGRAAAYIGNYYGYKNDKTTANIYYKKALDILCPLAESGDDDILKFIATGGAWTYFEESKDWGTWKSYNYWFNKAVAKKIPRALYLSISGEFNDKGNKKEWEKYIHKLESIAINGHIAPMVELAEAYLRKASASGWRLKAMATKSFKEKGNYWVDMIVALTGCNKKDILIMIEGEDW